MKYSTLFLLFVLLSGCSTIASKSGDDSEWGTLYSGTKSSPSNGAKYLGKSTHFLPQFTFVFVGAVVDFLASFAADTVVLPVDLVVAVTQLGNDESEDADAH